MLKLIEICINAFCFVQSFSESTFQETEDENVQYSNLDCCIIVKSLILRKEHKLYIR